MKITKGNHVEEVDLDKIIFDLNKEHETLYFDEICGQLFIYAPLSRKEYKKIISNPELNDMDKQDLICYKALLWPENFDFDNCLAGIPDALYLQIIQKSFLANVDDIVYLIDRFREESEELDAQMTCIINEAFPNYSLEEIEAWDMIKFTKMFARSEWKLKNLRNMDLNTDVAEFLQAYTQESNEDIEPQGSTEEVPSNNESEQILPNGKKKMTPEMLKAYREAVAKFPEIDWSKDAMFTGYETQTADITAPALRTGWR